MSKIDWGKAFDVFPTVRTPKRGLQEELQSPISPWRWPLLRGRETSGARRRNCFNFRQLG
jgi:hypothetical protein